MESQGRKPAVRRHREKKDVPRKEKKRANLSPKKSPCVGKKKPKSKLPGRIKRTEDRIPSKEKKKNRGPGYRQESTCSTSMQERREGEEEKGRGISEWASGIWPWWKKEVTKSKRTTLPWVWFLEKKKKRPPKKRLKKKSERSPHAFIPFFFKKKKRRKPIGHRRGPTSHR